MQLRARASHAPDAKWRDLLVINDTLMHSLAHFATFALFSASSIPTPIFILQLHDNYLDG